jgi:hypothetical protein
MSSSRAELETRPRDGQRWHCSLSNWPSLCHYARAIPHGCVETNQSLSVLL